jgi:two-component system cell cycle response regulator
VTLRVRLSLAFVLVVLVPLLVGAFLVAKGVPRLVDESAAGRLAASRGSAAMLVQETCQRVRLAAEVLGREAVATSAAPSVRDVVGRDLASYAVVTNPSGAIVASGGDVSGARPPPAALGSCTRGEASTSSVPVIGDSVELRSPAGRPLGRAAAAVPLDRAFVEQLARATGAEVTLVSKERVVAATVREDTARRIADSSADSSGQTTHADGRLVSAADVPSTPLRVVVSVERASVAGLERLLGLVVVGAIALAVVIGWQLARVTTRPLAELSDAAARVAGGDLETRIQVRGRDEVGRLAVAFNEMTNELHTHIRALESSRDELRRNLSRLGDTLSSTHDLSRILAVILDTAIASTSAQAGALFLTAHGRGDLYLKAQRGLQDRNVPTTARIPLGDGITGRVAASGEPVFGRVGEPGLERAEEEPPAGTVVSVPLRASGSVVGVLNLYDKQGGGTFGQADVETLRTFANGAAVAVDNVLLHQEAQRLSITDELTGLWNYRYFQMSLGKEIERAARFGRPLALLMLDIDHFKRVNDEHGHQRGDAVLAELATRVRTEIREVDALARYGGEELVLILPETGEDGAAHIADRICHVVRHLPFTGNGEPLYVTVSIGAAVFPANGMTGATLVRAADEALYEAKRGGRDQWRLAVNVGDQPVPVPEDA